MENFQSLKFLDLFRHLFEKIGIDYSQMRQILEVKLIMDKRRVPTVFNQNQSKDKKDGNQFLQSLWLYALFGLVLIPFILLGENFIFQMSVVFGIFMFILMTSMISDFSSVLLDLRDKMILQTKPVNRKTITAAKFVHVSLYMFFLTAAVMTIPLIVGLFKHGLLFFLVFLMEVILVNLFIIVFTALFYLFILRFFDGERLKDLINYVQILLSVGTVIGYQVVIRSFEFIDFNVDIAWSWWQYVIPPLWYGAPHEVLLNGKTDSQLVVFSILAFVVPIFSILLYVKLMPTFERYLEKLSEEKAKKKEQGNGQWFETVICSNHEERTFYRFAKIMMRNEREFKLKVYPSLGLSIVLPFLLFYNEFRYSSLESIASSQWYLSIYVCFMMIPTIVMMLKFSGKYKGSWIYQTTPIKCKASIYKGTLKAFLVRLFLPVFVLLSIFFIVLFKINVIPHLVAVLLGSFVYTVLCFKTLKKALPFSESFKAAQQGEGLTLFILVIATAVFVGLHYMSTMIYFGIYAYIIFLLIVNLIVWRGRMFK